MKTNYNYGFYRSMFLAILFCLTSLNYSSQTVQAVISKTITIQVVDATSKEAIPFANLVVYNIKGEQIKVGTTNLDGECQFILDPLDDYIFKAVYVGYEAKQDTLSCKLPGCIRHYTIEMNDGGGIACGDDGVGFCCCCCCCGCVIIEEAEDVQELERVMERTDIEKNIQEALNDFICYPNPLQNELHIQVNGLNAKEVLILNTAGACIKRLLVDEKNTDLEIDFSAYAKGAYYVICKGDGLSSHTKTIIKQ